MTTKTKSIEKTDRASEPNAPSRAFAQNLPVTLSQCANHRGGFQQLAGNLAVQRLFRAGVVQAKLAVSHPGDPDELEADRIAEQVVSSAPMATIQRKCAACEEGGASCPKCQEGEVLQLKEIPGCSVQATSVEHSQITALLGGGQPLPSSLRAFFEPRLARDFSNVRVHTDPSASNSALALNANAYTIGRDIVFGSGQYAPGTSDGRKLIAHELTHVVQQGNAASAPAHTIMSGQSALQVSTHQERSIQRQGPLLPGLTKPMPPIAPTPWLVPSIPRLLPPRLPPPVRWLPPPPIQPPVQPAPWIIPQTFPLPPVFPVPHEQPRPEEEERKRDQTCGSRDLPLTLVSFFPGSLGQGGGIKASPLTRCPGNTRGSKPDNSIYEDQFDCIQRSGQERNWLRGHILHGWTKRQGDQNLHGPGDTPANLIIIDQSLNQAMSSWIELAVMQLLYGPWPHVLWYHAWVDSYYPGLPFFADSISVEYGPYDTESGREGPRWNFGQFTLSPNSIPPYCPATEHAAAGTSLLSPYGSTSGFQSTLQICHEELESRVFSIPNGGLMVAINAKWVGRGPGEEAAGAEGEPEGCPSKNYHVALYQETFGYDDEISNTELPTRERIVLTWSQLEDDTYYLEITTDDEDPYCCLEGDITVTPFDAPAPKRSEYQVSEFA